MLKFTTTFKFEGYCSTFAKCPLLNCMHPSISDTNGSFNIASSYQLMHFFWFTK